jgi:hypothetical protein
MVYGQNERREVMGFGGQLGVSTRSAVQKRLAGQDAQ